MTILRAPGGPAHKRRLPTDATLAEIAALLVGSLVPVPTSPDGRILGGYRVGSEANPLPPDTRLRDLDPTEPLAFHFVPSRLLPVELTLENRTLRLDLASAVPLVSLIDGLCRQFDLPAGSWVLATPERDLSPFAYLGDDPPSTLTLSRR